MTETHLAETMDLAGKRAAYDNACKQLLAHKQILAQILCGTMREFVGIDATLAEGLICGNPLLPGPSVHASEIAGMPSEDARADEGRIEYDMLFETALPDGPETASVIVNVEVQRSRHSWRRLLRRAVYYCSRMISAQRGKTFKGEEYENLRKVVSVWICPEALKGPGTITTFDLECDQLCGLWLPNRHAYDVVQVAVIRLGDPERSSGLARMLSVLFSRTLKTSEKKRIAEEEYNMAMTDEMEEEVDGMGGFAEALWQEAIDEGRAIGMDEGRRMGIESALAAVSARLSELGYDEKAIDEVMSAKERVAL